MLNFTTLCCLRQGLFARCALILISVFSILSVNANEAPKALEWYSLDYQTVQGDFNGDGVEDLLLQPLRPEGLNLVSYGSLNSESKVEHLFENTQSTPIEFSEQFWHSGHQLFTTGDFNGDGFEDLLTLYRSDLSKKDRRHRKVEGYVFSGSKDGLNLEKFDFKLKNNRKLPFLDFPENYEYHAGDFNGDGKDDLFVQFTKHIQFPDDNIDISNANHYVVLSNKKGKIKKVKQSISLAEFSWLSAQFNPIVGDFNSDGRDDIFVQQFMQGSNHQLISSAQDGELLTMQPVTITDDLMDLSWNATDVTLFPYDVNEDNILDLMRIDTAESNAPNTASAPVASLSTQRMVKSISSAQSPLALVGIQASSNCDSSLLTAGSNFDKNTAYLNPVSGAAAISGCPVDLRPIPNTPSSISVPLSNATGSFNVNWTQVLFYPTPYYKLYQSKNSGSYGYVGSTSKGNLVVSGLTNGTYRYRVRACYAERGAEYCSGYKYSGNSYVSIPVPPPPPVAPVLSALPTYSLKGVHLNWSLSANANNFEVWRSANGATYSKWATFSGSTSSALGGLAVGQNCFKVRGVNTQGNGGFSNIRCTTLNNPPSVSLLFPSAGHTFGYRDSVYASASASDNDTGDSISKVTLSIPGIGAFNDTSAPYVHVFGAIASGTYTIKADAYDARGGSSGSSRSFTVKPNQAPSIAQYNGPSIAEDNTLVLNTNHFNISDEDDVSFTLYVYSGSNYTFSGTSITPAVNYDGSISVKVRVKDRGGLYSPYFYAPIDITPVNDAPTITSYKGPTIAEDSSLALSLSLFNIADVDSSSFTLYVYAGTNYTVSGNTITSSTSNYNGSLSVKVRVKDNAGAYSPYFYAPIDITPVNDAPTVISYKGPTIAEDSSLALSLSHFNITDVDSSSFTLYVYAGTNYTVSGNTITSSTSNYNGSLSVKVRVKDNAGAYSPYFYAPVDITPVNDAPVVVNDNLNVTEDIALARHVTTNDIDVDGDVLAISLVGVGSHGVAEKFSSTAVKYTPASNYCGSDSFTYVVSDGKGATGAGTISVNVACVNDAPIVNSYNGPSVSEDSSLALSLSHFNITDVDSSVFTLHVYAGTNYTVSGNTITSSTSNYNGSLSVKVRVRDNTGAYSSYFYAPIDITPVNDAPTVTSYKGPTIAEDSSLALSLSHFNIADVDSSSFTLYVYAGTNYTVSGNTITSSTSNYNGSLSVKVRVKDNAGAYSPYFYAPIDIAPVNDAPTVTSYKGPTINEGSSLALSLSHFNITDVDSSSFTLYVYAGTNYTVSGNAITPSTINYNGSLSVKVRVKDSSGAYSPYFYAAIDITPVNDAPIAVNDFLIATEDSAKNQHVTINDIDVDGDTLVISSVGAASHGVASKYSSTAVNYVPTSNYCGIDSFTYVVSDGHGGTDTGTVSVSIACVNDVPIAVNDNFTTLEDTGHLLHVTANDTDADGDTLVIASVGTASHGVASKFSNTSVTYVPNNHYCGSDSFTYVIGDNNGSSATGTVSVNVTCVNDIPIISGTPPLEAVIEQLYSFIPTVNDVEGGTLTFSIQNKPSWAAFTTSNGHLTGTPSATDIGTYNNIVIRTNDGSESAALNAFNVEVILDFTKVYQDAEGNLYIKLPESYGGKFYKLTRNGSQWLISEISQSDWDLLNLTLSSYSIDLNGFTGDVVEDINIVDSNSNAIIIVEDNVNPEPVPTAHTETIPAEKQGDNVGSLPGTVIISEQGASKYTIPLTLPTGKGGLTPNLAISYNSQSSNSILGVGWQLSGLSEIQRCRRTLEKDGYIRGIKFDSEDALCLDGQRLKLISGTAGVTGAQYRTELASLRNVTYNNYSSTLNYFVVAHKDGSEWVYGRTESSKQNDNASGETYRWILNKISDQFGNNIAFGYTNVSGKAKHILKVTYNGNEIDFNYELRTDKSETYFLGNLITDDQRLDSITIKNHLKAEINYYDFSYKNSGFSSRSLLTSVQRCSSSAVGNNCLPETTFEYSEPLFGLASNTSTINLASLIGSSGQILSASTLDFNADGLQDIAIAYRNETTGQGYIRLLKSTGTTYVGAHVFETQLSHDGRDISGDDIYSPVWLMGDMDGNGSSDLMYAKSYDSNNGHYVWQLNYFDRDGSTLSTEEYQFSMRIQHAILADMNVDGRPDLFVNGGYYLNTPTANSRFDDFINIDVSHLDDELREIIFEENGSPQNSPTDEADGDFFSLSTGMPIPIDFNGDGQPDLSSAYYIDWCMLRDQSYDCDSNTTRKRGESYLHPTFLEQQKNGEWITSSSNVVNPLLDMQVYNSSSNYARMPSALLYGDINGDGNTDIFHDGFILTLDGKNVLKVPGQTTKSGAAAVGESLFYNFIDINGDGLSDRVFKWTSNAPAEGFYANLSNGVEFENDDVFLFSSDIIYAKDNSVLWLDIDGDGQTGVVSLNKKTNILTLRNDANISNNPHDVLVQVTNGLGAVSDISYKPMNDSTVYTLGEGSHTLDWGNGSAVSDVINANFLVNNLSTDVSYNSSGAAQRSSIDYHYQGLKLQSGGRGYLGFEKTYKTDTRTNITNIRTYRQDFPYNGQLIKQETLYNDEIVEVIDNTLGTVLLNSSKNQHVYIETSTLQKFSFDYNDGTIGTRNAISTVITSNTYEAYSEGSVTLNGSYPLLSEQTITTTDHSQDDSVYSQTSTFGYGASESDSSYDNEELWWVGKVKSKTLVLDRTGVTDLTQKTVYEYDTENGRLSAEIIDPENSDNSYLKTAFTYDSVGNKATVTQCSIHYANDCATRETSTDDQGDNKVFRRTSWAYDADSRYLIEQKNLAFIEQQYAGFNALGQPTQITDVNGNVTDIRYDNFGQEYFRRTPAIGTFSYSNIYWCENSNSCPTNAKYYSEITSAGNVVEQQFFDRSGNVVKASKNGFDGTNINTLFQYDNFARATHTSVAHVANTSASNITWLENHYDIFGRAVQSINSSGAITNIHYNNNEVWQEISTNHNGYSLTRDRYEYFNALGESVAVKDGLTNTIYYSFDAMGKLDIVTGVDGVEIDANHDAYGRRTSLNDPDKGYWQYQYNGLGEQILSIAPDGVRTYDHLDNIGRVYSRLTKTSSLATIDSTSFSYVAHQLKTERLGTVSKVYGYDTQGRISDVTHTIDGTSYIERTTYDQFGRLFQQFDADQSNGLLNRRGLRYHYQNGYVSKQQEAREGTNGVYYYQVDHIDALGNITDYRQGQNEIAISKVFDDATGQLISVNSDMGMIQSLEYKFDGLGNLRTRQDNINEFMGTTELQLEEFGYDELNRLDTVSLNGYSTLSIDYTVAGNIERKSDVLSGVDYQYQQKASQCNGITGAVQAGPHAVSTIGSRQYCYDVKGNQTHQFDGSQQSRKVNYSHFDKPMLIESTLGTTAFSYDMNRSRYKRVDHLPNAQGVQQTTTTYYVGNLEIVHLPSGIIEYKRYLGDGALETVRNNNQNELIYLFKDHIGSTDVITDHNGLVKERLSFDAFGKRRNVAAWHPFDFTANFNDLLPVIAITPRGFTGHEHVDHANVIHMNGRIYDPAIGRFMQADPVVQEVDNSQNFNRYSYVLNNPLSYTDPTGYYYESDYGDSVEQWAEGKQNEYANQINNTEQFKGKNTDGTLKGSTNDGAGLREAKSQSAAYAAGLQWSVDTADLRTEPQIAEGREQLANVAQGMTLFSGLSMLTANLTLKAIKKTFSNSVDDALTVSDDIVKRANNLPVTFDGEFATKQLLGTTKTPDGKQINFHAADRMVNPPRGRAPMSIAEVEDFIDTANKIKKIKIDSRGTSVTLMNSKFPKAQVAVDGNRIITVVNPRKKK